MANQLSNLGLEINALAPGDVPTGAADKVLLYASGSGAAARLYVKSGADSQALLGTDLDSLTATSASLEQTDLLLFSDQDADGEERSITLSGLEDTIFANISAAGSTEVTIGAGGRAQIVNNVIDESNLMASVAGNGLAGGNGTALSVGVDDSSIEINSDSLRVKATGITNAMLAGSIANGKLSNSAITIAGAATSLGGTVSAATIAAAVDGEDMAITALTDLDFKTAGNKTIFDTVGDHHLTVGASGTTVIIAGNLTVQGSSSIVDSTSIHVSNSFTFEGPVDAHETTLHSGIPTADTTITLPVLPAGTYHLAALADGATAASSAVTAAEFAILDGGTASSTVTVVDADRLVLNDGGTMKQVSMDQFETYFESALDTLSNVTTVGALDAGSITSNFGAIDVGSSNISGGTLSGSALQTDAITLNGTAVSSTAAELNLVDGAAASTVVNSKAVIYGSSGEVNGTSVSASAAVRGASISMDGRATVGALTINSVAVTADAGEINLLDGSGAGNVVNSKAVIYSAAGQVNATSAVINTTSNTVRGLQVTGAIAATGKVSAGGANFAATGNGNQALNLVAVSQAKAAIITGSILVNGTSEFIGAMSIDGDLELPSDHTVKAQGFVTYSDRDLKNNIQPMGDALDKVMKLEAVSYDMKSNGKSEIGFIAQDVAKVVPEVCALDKMGVGRGIDYSRVSTLLVGAIKSQQEQIADLKETIDKLQNK